MSTYYFLLLSMLLIENSVSASEEITNNPPQERRPLSSSFPKDDYTDTVVKKIVDPKVRKELTEHYRKTFQPKQGKENIDKK